MRYLVWLLFLIAGPGTAQVIYPPTAAPDLSGYATNAALAAKADASAVTSSLAGKVDTSAMTSALSGKADQSAVAAMGSTIPTASATIPPCTADAGLIGTQITVFALANHTHCSKARRVRQTTGTDGLYVWNFSPAFSGAPICAATAETAPGVTDVINAQIQGTPTTSQATIRVNRTAVSVVALIGLSVLSVPASPGAQVFHAICIEP